MALETCANYLPRAVAEGDEEARSKMLLASSAAGMGFDNAGVHLCHGMSYPISSQVKDTYQTDYDTSNNTMDPHAMIPHGLSVIVAAPAVFEFTGVADPDRHATCARILKQARDPNHDSSPQELHPTGNFAGNWLADEIRQLLETLDVPLGLKQFGYTEDDLPSLVEDTLPQHRVTKIAPRVVGRSELEHLNEAAFSDAC